MNFWLYNGDIKTLDYVVHNLEVNLTTTCIYTSLWVDAPP